MFDNHFERGTQKKIEKSPLKFDRKNAKTTKTALLCLFWWQISSWAGKQSLNFTDLLLWTRATFPKLEHFWAPTDVFICQLCFKASKMYISRSVMVENSWNIAIFSQKSRSNWICWLLELNKALFWPRCSVLSSKIVSFVIKISFKQDLKYF